MEPAPDSGVVVPTCTAAPAVPAIDPPPRVVAAPALVLRGTREAWSAVLVGGVERAPASAATAWSAGVDLVEGDNAFAVSARNACGTSGTATVAIRFDPSEATFTLDPPPEAICDERFTLRGTKGGGVAIFVDGAEVVPADGLRTWSHQVMLAEGGNRVAVSGRAGSATLPAVFADLTLHSGRGPFSASATAAASSASRVVVFGNKPPYAGVEINGVLAVRPDARPRYSVEVDARTGPDAYVVQVSDACGRRTGDAIRIHYMANLAPLAVAITEPRRGAIVMGMVEVRGTVDPDAVSVALSVDGGAPFSAAIGANRTFTATWDTTALPRGAHTLEARAVDMTGLRTGAASVSVDVQNIGPLVSEDEATPIASAKPEVAALSNGDVAIVWESGAGDVRLRVYEQGIMPGAIVTVASGGAHDPVIAAAPGGDAHVVWSAARSLVLRTRRANGQLDAARSVVTSTGAVTRPHAAVDSQGTLHLVWEEGGGVRYAAGMQASLRVAASGSRPRVAVTPDGCPHVVYEAAGAIAYRGGCPLDTARILSEATHSSAATPAIAADLVEPTGLVYAVWSAVFRGARHVYLRPIAAGQPLSLLPFAPATAAAEPDIAVGADRTAHVVWRDDTATPDVFLDDAQAILPTAGRSLAPRLAPTGFVVWQDDSALDGDATPDTDILHRR